MPAKRLGFSDVVALLAENYPGIQASVEGQNLKLVEPATGKSASIMVRASDLMQMRDDFRQGFLHSAIGKMTKAS